MVLSTADTKSITAHQYYEKDSNNPKARAISAYEGQVEFSASFAGASCPLDLASLSSLILAYAKTFGEVRTIELVSAAIQDHIVYRCEYFKISAAESAVGITNSSPPMKVSASFPK